MAVLLIVMGGIADFRKKHYPVASHVFNFAVANAGMAVGVVKSLLGKSPAMFR